MIMHVLLADYARQRRLQLKGLPSSETIGVIICTTKVMMLMPASERVK